RVRWARWPGGMKMNKSLRDKRVRTSIFDICQEQRRARAVEQIKRAQRIAAVAQELGAMRSGEPGEWTLTCPHCRQLINIRENAGANGHVFTRQIGVRECPAKGSIIRDVRNALADEELSPARGDTREDQ